jgi:hypothetical protein
VDGYRAVGGGGEGELGEENLGLLGERGATLSGEARVVGVSGVDDSTIEADLADAGVRLGGEAGAQDG